MTAAQVLTKGVARIIRASGKIVFETQLRAQRFTGKDGLGLSSLRLPDGACDVERIFKGRARSENAAVVVRENDIILRHNETADTR
jgi:hypothetical protein